MNANAPVVPPVVAPVVAPVAAPAAPAAAPAAATSDMPRKPISGSKSVVLGALIVVTLVVAWFVVPGWNWVLSVATLTIFLMYLGYALTTRLLGFLINERKLMSLSRFQMALWTVLIIAAYLVIALMRVKAGVANPLVVTIDWQIWTLLGISTASLVGTPLLNDSKRKKEPGKDDQSKEEILAKAGQPFDQTSTVVDKNRDGLLYGNSSIDDARFTDLFEGDELSNSRFIELGQVQMFFFTVLVALVYAVQVFHLISSPGLATAPEASLPLLPEGLLALMGVSNAGYLGNKAIDRTPSS